ncbi:unnamed protein product, partial [Symbiodinium microadriaticum]
APEPAAPGAATALAAPAADAGAPLAVATPAGAAAVTLPAAEAVAPTAVAIPPPAEATVAMPAAGSPPPAQPAASPKPVPAPVTEADAPEPVLAKDQPPRAPEGGIQEVLGKLGWQPADECAARQMEKYLDKISAVIFHNKWKKENMSGISGNRRLEALKEFREHTWARFYAAFATKGKGGNGHDGMRQADNAEIAQPKEALRPRHTDMDGDGWFSVPGFYVVVLQRGATSEKWGFQWDRQAMDTLNVKVIEGIAPNSLASDWNRRFPDRAARKGDQLTKVNGLRDPAGMAAEMKPGPYSMAQPRDGEAKVPVPELRPKPELTPLCGCGLWLTLPPGIFHRSSQNWEAASPVEGSKKEALRWDILARKFQTHQRPRKAKKVSDAKLSLVKALFEVFGFHATKPPFQSVSPMPCQEDFDAYMCSGCDGPDYRLFTHESG